MYTIRWVVFYSPNKNTLINNKLINISYSKIYTNQHKRVITNPIYLSIRRGNMFFNVCCVVRSELYLEDQKLEIVQKPNAMASSASSYSLPVLEEMMGLKLYTNYRLPNVTEIIKSPMIIFNGPLRLNIYLLKSDVKVNKYVMEYKWLTSKVRNTVTCTESHAFLFNKKKKDIKIEISSAEKLFRQLRVRNARVAGQTLFEGALGNGRTNVQPHAISSRENHSTPSVRYSAVAVFSFRRTVF